MYFNQDHPILFTEIHKLLKSIGKSLKDFNQLPQPPSIYLDCGLNNLIVEETSYDIKEMEREHRALISELNEEQLQVYNSIMKSLQRTDGGFFFVYGSGGCGKTFLWKTLISKLRSESMIVLPVASSGIAATLLPGGRTAHSRFKIPIILDDCSTCNIAQQSDISQLLQKTSLIIWDEAPMQHRYAFECLDRSLRDIMKSVDPKRFHIPFGGINIVLGGDFRQILPVIPGSSRAEVVSASVIRSKLWKNVELHTLVQNMRINKGTDPADQERMKNFAQWVLDIGDGEIERAADGAFEDDICIPSEFCNVGSENCIDDMIDSTFPEFAQHFNEPSYLSERAILTPTNSTVAHVNSLIVERIPGESQSYYSVDHAEDYPGTETELNNSFPPEYLNSLSVPGLPTHELKLKVGVVVMLMRNLNQTLGLCNGTRMMVTRLLPNCVECEVISGNFVGTKHFIPRMELFPTDSKLPYKLMRKQMPLQICYAMTINKSQGQSLKNVGLYLPKPVFSHGQLYVAISRVTSPEGLRIYIESEMGLTTNITQNVVYKEVFNNLPCI